MDFIKYNRKAWNAQVEKKNEWTIPVSPEEIAAARKGDLKIYLTPARAVPLSWFGNLEGTKILCLASGGGQQGPLLAAAGADVTVFDNSDNQLEQDRLVAQRENLNITTIQGDMKKLSPIQDETFDLIVHPVSNVFVDILRPVWEEAYRVLRKGGAMLSGFMNPLYFLFDEDKLWKEGTLEITKKIPYSHLENMTKEDLDKRIKENEPLEFSHTLEEQIQGQIAAGFVLIGFYDDTNAGKCILDEYIPCYCATRALKL